MTLNGTKLQCDTCDIYLLSKIIYIMYLIFYEVMSLHLFPHHLYLIKFCHVCVRNIMYSINYITLILFKFAQFQIGLDYELYRYIQYYTWSHLIDFFFFTSSCDNVNNNNNSSNDNINVNERVKFGQWSLVAPKREPKL